MIPEREVCVDQYEKRMIDLCLRCGKIECTDKCPEADRLQMELEETKRQDGRQNRVKKKEAAGKVKLYEVNGVKHSLAGWALEIGIAPYALKRRLEIMPMEEAVRIPKGQQMRGQEPRKPSNSAGETHTIKEWAEIAGIERVTLYARLRKGMTLDEALSKPVQQQRRRRRK